MPSPQFPWFLFPPLSAVTKSSAWRPRLCALRPTSSILAESSPPSLTLDSLADSAALRNSSMFCLRASKSGLTSLALRSERRPDFSSSLSAASAENSLRRRAMVSSTVRLSSARRSSQARSLSASRASVASSLAASVAVSVAFSPPSRCTSAEYASAD